MGEAVPPGSGRPQIANDQNIQTRLIHPIKLSNPNTFAGYSICQYSMAALYYVTGIRLKFAKYTDILI
jgi:hypothetical protein